MPGTRYDRFLDIHLVARVAPGETAEAGKGVGDRRRHAYDFRSDVQRQLQAYETKHVLPTACHQIGHVLGERDGNRAAAPGILRRQLESLRYVACFVTSRRARRLSCTTLRSNRRDPCRYSISSRATGRGMPMRPRSGRGFGLRRLPPTWWCP